MSSSKSIYDASMPNVSPQNHGNVSIEYAEKSNAYFLYYNGIPWMGTDIEFVHAKDTLYSQYDQAYGDVLITGLGFGILAKALSEKDEVSSVTVLELHDDVIEAFLAHNTLNNKVRIVQADASNYESDIKYDCLLPDHYELQSFNWKVSDMNSLANRISHDVFWPWSIEEMFLDQTYPKLHYVDAEKTKLIYDEAAVFTKYLPEISGKWRAFIETHFPNKLTLLNIEPDRLILYLQKFARHYYN